MVLDDDEQGDGRLNSDEEDRPLAFDHEPGEDGKTRRAENGSQRNIASQSANNRENGNCGQRSPGSGNQKDAESGRDPLPPVKVQPHWKHVAENRKKSCQRFDIALRHRGKDRTRDHGRKQDRERAFANIKKECSRSKGFAPGTKNVGGADVAAAHGTDVLAAKDTHQ